MNMFHRLLIASFGLLLCLNVLGCGNSQAQLETKTQAEITKYYADRGKTITCTGVHLTKQSGNNYTGVADVIFKTPKGDMADKLGVKVSNDKNNFSWDFTE